MEWAVPLIALSLLAFAAVSGRLAGTSLTAPIVFTLVGLLFGAKALDLVNPAPAHEAVKLLAEATLTVALFGDAARTDLRALRREFGIPSRLLGFGLPLTIAIGFGVARLLFPSMAWPEAMLVALMLAPTDAALGQAVVTLTAIPSRVRLGLNVESGLNDGICVPLFLVVLGVAASDAGLLRGSHLPSLLARQIGYGALFGALAGGVGGFLALRARRHLVDPAWLQIMPVASAALAFSSADAVGGSGFIAAFAGGLVFGRFTQRATAEMSYLLDQLDALLAAATFIVFGAVLLEPALGRMTWAVLGYALLSLTVVRMVSVAIAMAGTRLRRPTLAFLGWFGPRGLASIVFAILLIEEEGTLPNEGVILTTVFITIGLSILLHGVSAAPLGDRYARWAATHSGTDGLDASADS